MEDWGVGRRVVKETTSARQREEKDRHEERGTERKGEK